MGFGLLPSGPQMGTVDRMPHIRPAGLAPGDPEETMDAVLSASSRAPPPTPDEVKRWRRDYTPGKSQVPPGSALDTAHLSVGTYGKVEPRLRGESVADNMDIVPKSSLLERQQEKREAIYNSNKMEPLGRPFTRGHKIPERMLETGFGRPTPQDIMGTETKEGICPPEEVPDPLEHELYVKSHASYDPGEQRSRGYSWTSKDGPIDPRTYGFGAITTERDVNGVGKAINPSRYGLNADPTAPHPPSVVDLKFQAYREYKTDKLGKPRSLGHDNTKSDVKVFGKPSMKEPQWGAKECIGNYTAEQQQPDLDLGRSIRPGWRNVSMDPDRAYGIPSIRYDIAAPSMRGVADFQNYGDEKGANQILNPDPYAELGVEPEDFAEPLPLDTLIGIFSKADLGVDEEAITRAYESTLGQSGGTGARPGGTAVEALGGAPTPYCIDELGSEGVSSVGLGTPVGSRPMRVQTLPWSSGTVDSE
eukprot:scaffold20937_cov33-Tisochrysis_lutea.AAC.1